MCLAASLEFNTPFPCIGEFTEILGNIFLDGRKKNSFTSNLEKLLATNNPLVRYLGGRSSYLSATILGKRGQKLMKVVLRLIGGLKNCPLHFKQGEHHNLLNLHSAPTGSLSFPHFTSLLRQPTQVVTVKQEGGGRQHGSGGGKQRETGKGKEGERKKITRR